MRYTEFGKTGYNISAVTYGGVISMQDGQEASYRYVPWAIENGVNYFDVAPGYGDAQEKLGNALKPYRKDIYLACKTQKRTRPEAENDFRESMRLLHTDHFDVYQLHAMSTDEDIEKAFGKNGVVEMIDKLKTEGYIRKAGITAHSERIAVKALEMYDFDTVLFPFNWHMNLEYGFGNRLLKIAHERGKGLLSMKSMIDRAWTDGDDRSKYPKSWCRPFDTDNEPDMLVAAMKYVWSLGVNTIIPPGNFDHFRFAVNHIDEIVDSPINDRELDSLKDHLSEVRGKPFFGKEMYNW
ncbi:MAG: aldo/keto reductase [Clostridiales bacterium]|nr:aldo/keto reductase [Clostridiales bacterium]